MATTTTRPLETVECPACGQPHQSDAPDAGCAACGAPLYMATVALYYRACARPADGSPDRPYTLRVADRGIPERDAYKIRGAIGAYFGEAAAWAATVTTRDGSEWRACVPNLGPGSTCYVVEWR